MTLQNSVKMYLHFPRKGIINFDSSQEYIKL